FVHDESRSSATTGTLAFTTPATVTSDVGQYAIVGGGLAANHGNYIFEQAASNTSALTITPADLTIVAHDASKIYGDTLGFSGDECSASGLKNGETIGSVDLSSAGSGVTAGVANGPYAITIGDATGGSFDAYNYRISYVRGRLTVDPAPLT